VHLSSFQLPTGMQLDRGFRMRLLASTASPQLGQLIRQGNATAVLQDHCTEAAQQLHGHLVSGLHYDAGHLFQPPMQEVRTRLGKALVYRRIADCDGAQLRGGGEHLQAGIGVLLPAEDQHLH
jgi:hypothetical protein